MKKPVSVSILVSLGVLLTASFAFSEIYIIKKISDDRSSFNQLPQINEKGEVVWTGNVGNGYGVFLNDGTAITQLDDNNVILDAPPIPKINASGQVVWHKVFQWWDTPGIPPDADIFHYNGNTTQLSNDRSTFNLFPQINSSGHVVWDGYEGMSMDREIFLYDGSITQISDGRATNNWNSQINENGQVVWEGVVGTDSHIFLYNGTAVTQISEPNSVHNQHPRISDNGHVVWYGTTDTGRFIFLYDGTIAKPLDDRTGNNPPQINAMGQAVWDGYDNTLMDAEIFLYNGTNITQLSDDSTIANEYPGINSKGQVVWDGIVGTNEEIFIHDGATLTQLTFNDAADILPQINSEGQVVWERWDGTTMEIYLATPISAIPPIAETPSRYPVVDRPSRYPIINAPSGAPTTNAPSGTPPDLGRRIEIIDYCKTHPRECIWKEYMVFDPPLPAPVRMGYRPLGTVRTTMEAARCPQCSFSRSWYPPYMPKEVIGLYGAGQTYIKKGRTPESLEGITVLIKNAPVGERFTKKEKESALGNLKKSVSKKADTSRETLYAAINAMDLDWRVPPLEAQKVAAGKNAKVDFQGVSTVRFGKVEKSGKASLKVKSGMPAVAEGFEPGRPLASYAFDYRGKGSGDMNVSIYFGGMDFTGDPSSLRLLRWDGKAYTDVTTVIDVPNRIITGRTDRLSTFVIMSQSSQPMKNLKHMKQMKHIKQMK